MRPSSHWPVVRPDRNGDRRRAPPARRARRPGDRHSFVAVGCKAGEVAPDDARRGPIRALDVRNASARDAESRTERPLGQSGSDALGLEVDPA